MTRISWRKASVLAVALITLLLASYSDSAHAQRARAAFRIMIITDGPSDPLAKLEGMFKKELLELAGDNARLTFIEPRTKTDWTLTQATAAVEEALKDRRLDLIVLFGAMTGVAVGQRATLRTPVLIPFAAPELQGLPQDGDRSGRRNLTYISGLLDLEREFQQMLDIVPFDRLAFIAGNEVIEHLQDATKPVELAADEVGIDTTLVVAHDDVQATLDAIPADAQAVYIGPLLKWSDEQVQQLIDGINQRRLPSYTSDSVGWVERGALATMETDEDRIRRLRRAALYAQRIFSGEAPETLSVSFEPRHQLTINMATVRAISVWPRFAVMAEARMINDTAGGRGPVITLETAMREAVLANLDLMAVGFGVRAERETYKAQRGRWLPQAGAGGDFTVIDSDIASPVGAAQRQFTWGISGSQLVYSPQTHGLLRSARARWRGSKEDYNSVRLDVMFEAGVAYLDVLRAKNNERVSRDNLRLTRRNLALAEMRNRIGVAGREEVFRWQTEIAQARSDIILASAIRNQAEIELNRVLNQPLERPFQTPPESEIRTELPGSNPRLIKYLQDPWSFRVFREFMADEAVRNSPEVRGLDQTILARREILKAERRALGIPDFSIFGGFEQIPFVDGVGSEAIDPAATGGIIPSRDTFSWNLGAAAALTLFDGTSNYARIRRAHRNIDRFKTERAAIALQLQADVRSALHQAGWALANIQLTRDAADAASRNLELVTDLYQRGVADIIRLIDAQNQAITSELAASNARYDFMIDALTAQRASGEFSLEGTQEEQDDFLRRLDEFAAQRRRELKPVTPTPNPAPQESQ